jgi:hypothetical protein
MPTAAAPTRKMPSNASSTSGRAARPVRRTIDPAGEPRGGGVGRQEKAHPGAVGRELDFVAVVQEPLFVHRPAVHQRLVGFRQVVDVHLLPFSFEGGVLAAHRGRILPEPHGAFLVAPQFRVSRRHHLGRVGRVFARVGQKLEGKGRTRISAAHFHTVSVKLQPFTCIVRAGRAGDLPERKFNAPERGRIGCIPVPLQARSCRKKRKTPRKHDRIRAKVYGSGQYAGRQSCPARPGGSLPGSGTGIVPNHCR